MDNRDADGHDWSLSERVDPPARGRLREVSAPTMLIVGDHDVSFMIDMCARLGREIRGARCVTLENADHLPNMRRAEEFNRVVLDFLAG